MSDPQRRCRICVRLTMKDSTGSADLSVTFVGAVSRFLVIRGRRAVGFPEFGAEMVGVFETYIEGDLLDLEVWLFEQFGGMGKPEL